MSLTHFTGCPVRLGRNGCLAGGEPPLIAGYRVPFSFLESNSIPPVQRQQPFHPSGRVIARIGATTCLLMQRGKTSVQPARRCPKKKRQRMGSAFHKKETAVAFPGLTLDQAQRRTAKETSEHILAPPKARFSGSAVHGVAVRFTQMQVPVVIARALQTGFGEKTFPFAGSGGLSVERSRDSTISSESMIRSS